MTAFILCWKGLRNAAVVALLLLAVLPLRVLADADEPASANSTTLGLQPISGPIPQATAAPGESPVFQRSDGAYQADSERARTR